MGDMRDAIIIAAGISGLTLDTYLRNLRFCAEPALVSYLQASDLTMKPCTNLLQAVRILNWTSRRFLCRTAHN